MANKLTERAVLPCYFLLVAQFQESLSEIWDVLVTNRRIIYVPVVIWMIFSPISRIQRMVVDIPICVWCVVVFLQCSKWVEVIDLVRLKYFSNAIFKTRTGINPFSPALEVLYIKITLEQAKLIGRARINEFTELFEQFSLVINASTFSEQNLRTARRTCLRCEPDPNTQ
ncbi:hypothetical protein C471_13746 [Halorubrum saccharovorum DSM 1137]|uniref:Uncharacterized protein n=1 Tax=Halorubrum saccharovorum DSM 1137 TaxID=1227484 RepID=M0DNB3_9EURY|nr:hypothetical protein C471_13746 [Halorubrum saccharovorum DSM 1137]